MTEAACRAMIILGIETSCDETAAAVTRGREVLSSVVYSQVAAHRPYGGVVPEIASRHHLEHLPGVLEEALLASGLGWGELDAVAVTYGPGLATSLLIGLSAAKGLALRLARPIVAINHLEAHLYSAFLDPSAPGLESVCPALALIVSGGHTCLLRVEGLGKYRLLGWTRDDAAGEAFDKGAALLGLGYPGGPAIDRASAGGNAGAVAFPRGPRPDRRGPETGLGPLDFSFSGLKTSLLNYLKADPVSGRPERLADVAASYQEAIVDALARGVAEAVRRENLRAIVVSGGVSLNSRLRSRLAELAQALGCRLLLARPEYCADNAAMVAALAGAGGGRAGWNDADACPGLSLGEDALD
mgnify:CR=1 FL=1